MTPTEITASFEELMRQGPMTAQVYLNDCLKIVDGTFGDRPRLIATRPSNHNGENGQGSISLGRFV